MEIHLLDGGSQRLDGGAMFGNCPRALWSRWMSPDEQHRVVLACRPLLVREASGRIILFEAGIGAFFEPSRRKRYGVASETNALVASLAALGLVPDDVDVVVLSHLHFDHAGGLLADWQPDRAPSLVFSRATFVVGEGAWGRARNPHLRDRASFVPELVHLLEQSGRLALLDSEHSSLLGEPYGLSYSEGHTPGLMGTRIEAADPGPIHFASDLIPGRPWIHLPITMGYDRFPERLVEEKEALLDRVAESGEWLALYHDPEAALCRVRRRDDGRFEAIDARAADGITPARGLGAAL